MEIWKDVVGFERAYQVSNLSRAIKVKESYMNVDVSLCENGTLYIDDAETDEQLAVFKVVEED